MVLDKKWGAPTITNDGVTIAKEVELEDPWENMGAQLCKEVATKTNDVAGDGTTTATVLARAMVKGGMKNVAAGANPMALKRGIEKAVEAAVEAIKNQAQGRGVQGRDRAGRVDLGRRPRDRRARSPRRSTRSARTASITVEESNTFGIELEFVEGMQFDKGYISPYFVTDPERQEAVLDDPYILIVNKKISSVQELLPLLEKVLQAGQAARDHRRGRRRRGARHARREQDPRHVQRRRVKAPGFGDRRKAMLQDIAILTGGQVVSEEVGLKLENVDARPAGSARARWS